MARKVIARIKGGLGNQLFIYSFAYELSRKLSSKLILDDKTGFYKDSYGRKPVFNKLVCKSDYRFIKVYEIITFYLCKILSHDISEKLGVKFLIELDNKQRVSWYSQDFSKVRIVFIEGYFQSYEYFYQSRFEIKTHLKFKIPHSDYYIRLEGLIRKSNSVAIHIRRRDYTNILDMDYYHKSIGLIKKSLISPYFFFFCDDIEWLNSNLGKFNTQNNYIVSTSEMNELMEFTLMSLCKNFIIANSSYSWWAAYLAGIESDGMVLAPDRTDIGVIDAFYPNSWLLVKG
ncbi:MAG: alpha-1,2-fucosyltransferase [Sediminibacterium sp.]|nr:alpha-1,2-fucosyltransferase [Sediminibacterium sp.]